MSHDQIADILRKHFPGVGDFTIRSTAKELVALYATPPTVAENAKGAVTEAMVLVEAYVEACIAEREATRDSYRDAEEKTRNARAALTAALAPAEPQRTEQTQGEK